MTQSLRRRKHGQILQNFEQFEGVSRTTSCESWFYHLGDSLEGAFEIVSKCNPIQNAGENIRRDDDLCSARVTLAVNCGRAE